MDWEWVVDGWVRKAVLCGQYYEEKVKREKDNQKVNEKVYKIFRTKKENKARVLMTKTMFLGPFLLNGGGLCQAPEDKSDRNCFADRQPASKFRKRRWRWRPRYSVRRRQRPRWSAGDNNGEDETTEDDDVVVNLRGWRIVSRLHKHVCDSDRLCVMSWFGSRISNNIHHHVER